MRYISYLRSRSSFQNDGDEAPNTYLVFVVNVHVFVQLVRIPFKPREFFRCLQETVAEIVQINARIASLHFVVVVRNTRYIIYKDLRCPQRFFNLVGYIGSATFDVNGVICP